MLEAPGRHIPFNLARGLLPSTLSALMVPEETAKRHPRLAPHGSSVRQRRVGAGGRCTGRLAAV